MVCIGNGSMPLLNQNELFMTPSILRLITLDQREESRNTVTMLHQKDNVHLVRMQGLSGT